MPRAVPVPTFRVARDPLPIAQVSGRASLRVATYQELALLME